MPPSVALPCAMLEMRVYIREERKESIRPSTISFHISLLHKSFPRIYHFVDVALL